MLRLTATTADHFQVLVQHYLCHLLAFFREAHVHFITRNVPAQTGVLPKLASFLVYAADMIYLPHNAMGHVLSRVGCLQYSPLEFEVVIAPNFEGVFVKIYTRHFGICSFEKLLANFDG